MCSPYDGKHQILVDISFSVVGETIAFVGHTGSEIVYYQCPHAFYEFQSVRSWMWIRNYSQQELRKISV